MSNIRDGTIFGKWLVKEVLGNHCLCKCECGTDRMVAVSSLVKGLSNSCGRCLTIHKKIETGDIFTTKQGCKCIVLDYKGAFNVTVQFLDHNKHVKRVSTGDLRKGEVGNPFFPSFFGVGYLGVDTNSESGFKTTSREHMFWKGFMERCYSEFSLVRSPSYQGCVVDDYWHNFQNFAVWCQSQKGFNEKGWQVDKDILSGLKSGKLYGPDVCVFVPAEVNTLFIVPSTKTDELPTGVSYCKDRGNYQAGCGAGGFRKALGRFTTPDLAYEAYLRYKKIRVQEVVEKYKDRLDERVVAKLKEFYKE